MIVQKLVEWLMVFISFVVGLWPDWSPPEGPGLTMFRAANIVLPLDTISFLFGATLAVTGVGLTIWAVMKVVNVLRGSGA